MYLRIIYEIDEAGEKAHTTDIALMLGIAPASVTEMLGKLVQCGLVSHKSYGTASLTKKGKALATKVIRKNRLLQLCLPLTLGISSHEAGQEACRLEHALSDSLDQRICQMMGRPRYSPQKKLIPHCIKSISCERCLASPNIPRLHMKGGSQAILGR